jgi:hypothetical protein
LDRTGVLSVLSVGGSPNLILFLLFIGRGGN